MVMDERTPRGARGRSHLWWIAATGGGGLAAAHLALLVSTWNAPSATAYEGRASALAFLLVAGMFLVTGLLVVRPRPGNMIGWMLVAIGLTFLLYNTVVEYTLYGALARSSPPGVGAAAVLTQALWIVPFGLLPALLLLYPTGRVFSPAWGRVLRATVTAVVAGPVLVTAVLWPTRGRAEAVVLGDTEPALSAVARTTLAVIVIAVTAVLLTAVVAAIASLVVRWRRADGVERLQLKWLMLSGSLLGTAVLASGAQVLPVVVPRAAVDALLICGLASMPLTIALAVTRYRLFEIDRIVSRTVIYTLVTALVGGVYAACILVASLVLPGELSELAVAVSTLVAAAVFLPVRRRIGSMVDRRFDRARYDAARTVESFGARVRREVDLETLAGDLREAATGTVQPASSWLWLRPRPPR
jgi:hypothetical protein